MESLETGRPANQPQEQLAVTGGLEQLFTRADYVVNKNYLMALSSSAALEQCDERDIAAISEHTKFFRIQRLVYDKNENNLEKLTSLYAAAHVLGANLALLFHSDGKTVEFYLGVCNMGGRVNPALQAVFNNVRGNFPGSLGNAESYDDLCLTDDEMAAEFNQWFRPDNDGLAAVSAIPAIRGEEIIDNEKFVQGIEKVIDTMRGIPFTAVILAQNISGQDLADIKAEYELLYTALSPYAKNVISYGENQSDSVSSSLAHSISYSEGISRSKTLSVGVTDTITHSESDTETETDTETQGESKDSALKKITRRLGKTKSKSTSHSTSRAHSITDSTSIAHTKSEANTEGSQENVTTGDTDTKGRAITIGSSITSQLEYHNKSIEALLEQIDAQLKRLQNSACYGMYGTAAYFIAPSMSLAQTAASAYKSIISGKGSFVETAQICTWSRAACKAAGNRDFTNVENSLRCFRHPAFSLPTGDIVTPATLVSGQELAIEMGFPMKPIPGVSVIETVPFGRNIYSLSKEKVAPAGQFKLGNIYHMWEEEVTPVKLDCRSLTGHTFVTGSTGSGKSNTVYWMLDQLTRDEDVHFMVVEPAKGEYKDAFGGRKDVSVYGTNPERSELLRINPFAFPVDEIRVQEHLDRLIEIFNVCWPMYAAMPAILKDACERAYVSVGWDMTASVNRVDPQGFPSFGDVLREVRAVVQESDYSSDNKGDYTGALVTRLRSLTTGIFGQVFTNDTDRVIQGEALFDRNVIVDLSRVGSSETKSLIMGILVMQLQEYRMAKAEGSDSDLRHVTVLEEAHNLLKRTSSEQSAEGANLAGKSVEMLSNAIAEMRTYGEGFIIADQAPGLLDMAAIRNTNTKIIMRLPDQSDRELVGKAAGLNDDQIGELAKLPKGVAAVYQNDWLEAVLCKVEHFAQKKALTYTPPTSSAPQALGKYFAAQLSDQKYKTLKAEEIESLEGWLKGKASTVYTKQLFQKGLQEKLEPRELGALAYNLFDGRGLCRRLAQWDESTEAVIPIVQTFTGECDLPDAQALALCIRIAERAAERIEEKAFHQKVEKFCCLKK